MPSYLAQVHREYNPSGHEVVSLRIIQGDEGIEPVDGDEYVTVSTPESLFPQGG